MPRVPISNTPWWNAPLRWDGLASAWRSLMKIWANQEHRRRHGAASNDCSPRLAWRLSGWSSALMLLAWLGTTMIGINCVPRLLHLRYTDRGRRTTLRSTTVPRPITAGIDRNDERGGAPSSQTTHACRSTP